LLPRSRALTAERVRRLLARRLGQERSARIVVPYEADEDIRKLAAQITFHATGERHKLNALRRYFRERGFLERYDRGGLYTAVEVMRTGRGSCLSMANFFVALARAAGLRASYLDASEHDSEFGKSGSVLVRWGHVLVGVQVGSRWVAVEFDGRLRRPQRYRLLSDLEVIADYYNNVGSQKAWSPENPARFAAPEVIEAFTIATCVSPRFTRAWNNLGVALSRADRPDEAARAYRRAIALNPDFAAARANLGQLLRRNGDLEAALEMLAAAVRLEPDNAHYRYFLGRALAEAGRHGRALEHLRAGLARDGKFFLIRLQMARIFELLGQDDRARQQARRVLELIPGQRDARMILQRLGR